MTFLSVLGPILGFLFFCGIVMYCWPFILLIGLIIFAVVSDHHDTFAGAIHDDTFWLGIAMIGIGVLPPILSFFSEKKDSLSK